MFHNPQCNGQDDSVTGKDLSMFWTVFVILLFCGCRDL